MYIKRHAEDTVSKLSKMFGAVLVTGPRQVGKTTMLKKATEGVSYVTLDDPMLLATAVEQSGTFLKTIRRLCLSMKFNMHRIYSAYKIIIDRDKKKGNSICLALSNFI